MLRWRQRGETTRVSPGWRLADSEAEIAVKAVDAGGSREIVSERTDAGISEAPFPSRKGDRIPGAGEAEIVTLFEIWMGFGDCGEARRDITSPFGRRHYGESFIQTAWEYRWSDILTRARAWPRKMRDVDSMRLRTSE